MLRFALLVLLLANAGYLAWSQGWMATLGWAPEEQAEPYRLKQQVRPEVLSIVQPGTAATTAAPTPASAPAASVAAAPAQPMPPEPLEEIIPEATVCLQSENMNEAQYRMLQEALRCSDLPSSSLYFLSSHVTCRWLVYLG